MIATQRPPGTGIFAPEPDYRGQAWQFSKIGQGPSYMKMEKRHEAQADRVVFTSTCEGPDCSVADELVVEMSHSNLEGSVPAIDLCIRQQHAATGIHLQFAQQRGESFEDQRWESGIHQVVLSRDVQSGRTTLAAFSPGSELPAYFADVQNARPV